MTARGTKAFSDTRRLAGAAGLVPGRFRAPTAFRLRRCANRVIMGPFPKLAHDAARKSAVELK